MAYEVLYRKYRPRDFAGLVGQEHVRKALEHALEHDRLHHAYLFTGTRGVGKTTIARILARCLNCERGVSLQPCGECASCLEIDSGRFIDLIEVDAASRTKVEDTRELLDNVQYPPVRGRYKVYLIDEVHMLSNSSFNALLKTLEEPPPRVVFLLATTEPKRLPVTVLSRCLQFSLKSYRPDQITAHLREVMQKEAITADERALRLIARAARGSMRDALSLADQAIAHGGGELSGGAVESLLGTIDLDELGRLGRAIAAGDAGTLMAVSSDLAGAGADFDSALQRLSALWHAVAVVQAGVTRLDDAEDATLANELSRQLDPAYTQLLYQISVIGLRDLQLAPEPRIGFEMALLRMLAFSPAPEDVVPVAAPAPAAAVARAAPAAQVAAVPAAAVPAAGVPAAGVPAAGVPAAGVPAAGVPAAGVPAAGVPAADASAAPAADAAVDAAATGRAGTAEARWFDLAPRLALTGMARDIAMHLVPVQLDADPWRFELEPGRMALLAESHVDAIGSAIAAVLATTLPTTLATDAVRAPRLQITPATRPGDTPAAHVARVERQHREELLASVRADPVVRALQDRFGASIDESSLRSR